MKAPVASGLLAIAGAASGNDFRKDGRTMETLGLVSQKREALMQLLHEGI